MAWTDEMFIRASDLGGQGYSAGYIASALTGEFCIEVSRNAVIGKLKRQGISFGIPRSLGVTKRSQSKPHKPRTFSFSRMAAIQRIAEEAAPLPPEPPKPPEFLGLTVTQLTDNTCRYPRGDGPFFFCGQPPKEGSPYCEFCHSICYATPTPAQLTRSQSRAASQSRIFYAEREART